MEEQGKSVSWVGRTMRETYFDLAVAQKRSGVRSLLCAPVLQLSLCKVIQQLCAGAHRGEGTESLSLPPALGTEPRPLCTLDKTYH